MEISIELVVSAVISLISVLVTIYQFYKSKNYSFDRERLEKTIFPLYIKLEPYLYKYNLNDNFRNIIEDMNITIKNNRFLIGNKLYYFFSTFYDSVKSNKKDKIIQKEYNEFCNQLINTYDKLCSNLGLTRINMIYRLRHRLYGEIKRTILVVWLIIQAIICFAIAYYGLILLINNLITFIKNFI
ncbi:MAG: hypothetical protein AB9835_13665 [Eubacteriales bacterium]